MTDPKTSKPEKQPADDLTQSRYDIVSQHSKQVRKLGGSDHSEVWLVQHIGQLEAHKVLASEIRFPEAVFREALRMRQVQHQNVVQVFGVEDIADAPVLRMEYVEGRDLGHVVEDDGAFPAAQLLPLAIQIVDALAAAHERGIFHRDLKASNLILREDGKSVLITDFGVSSAMREDLGRSGLTLPREAPEMATEDGRPSVGSDIWSLGVTLHYLLTLEYPFPFRDMETAEAVQQPPRDLRKTHPSVPAELAALLLRMLAADPAERIADIEELKRELEQMLSRVACPACGQLFDRDTKVESCPHPECASSRFAPFLRGQLELTAAQTALAMCEFKDARSHFHAAKEAFSEAEVPEFAEVAGAGGGAITDQQEELDRLISAARSEMDQGRLVEATRRLQQARTHFSRSSAVRDLRADLRAMLTEAYMEVKPRVIEGLATRKFHDAREALNRIDLLLSDSAVRREIGIELGEDPKSFQDLSSEVEAKELNFTRYHDSGRAAILEFDFEKAQRVYTALESEFSSEENVEMLAKLRRIPSAMEYARKYPVDVLTKIVEDPALLAGAKRNRLKRVNKACTDVLADFPAAEYETFAEIEELRALTEKAATVTRAYVDEKRDAARVAQDEGNVAEELQLIRSIEPIVTRGDLFTPSSRQYVQHRQRQLEELLKSAEAKYDEGMRAVEQRDYIQAQMLFREVQNEIPDGFKDTDARLEEVTTTREKLAGMRQEVSYELGEVERGRFTPESAATALKAAAEYEALASDVDRAKLQVRMIKACTALMDSQKEQLSGTTGANRALVEQFVPLMRLLSSSVWIALFEASPDLLRGFCTLLCGAHASGVSRNLEAEIGFAREYLSAIAPLSDELRAVVPPLGTEHPMDCAAKAVDRAFEASPDSEKQETFAVAANLCREMEALAPDSVRSKIQERANEFDAWGRRAALESKFKSVKSVARKVVPPVAALFVGIILGLTAFGTDSDDGELKALQRMAAGYQFANVSSSDIEEFLGSTKIDPDRARYLVYLRDLQDYVKKPESVHPAQWAATFWLMNDDLNSLPKELGRLAKKYLRNAVQHAYRGLLGRATKAIEAGAAPLAVNAFVAQTLEGWRAIPESAMPGSYGLNKVAQYLRDYGEALRTGGKKPDSLKDRVPDDSFKAIEKWVALLSGS